MTDIRIKDYFTVCAYVANEWTTAEDVMDAVNIAMLTFSTSPTIAWEACRILDIRKERRLNKRLVGEALPISFSFAIGIKNRKAFSLKNRQY